jgi:hypothetical protein
MSDLNAVYQPSPDPDRKPMTDLMGGPTSERTSRGDGAACRVGWNQGSTTVPALAGFRKANTDTPTVNPELDGGGWIRTSRAETSFLVSTTRYIGLRLRCATPPKNRPSDVGPLFRLRPGRFCHPG